MLMALLALRPAIAADASSSSQADDFRPYHDAISGVLDGLLRTAEDRTKPERTTPADLTSVQNKGSEPAKRRQFASQYWAGRDQNLEQAIGRLATIRPALEQILEAEGVPKSLVAVVLVESAAQPFALSPKQARGLWQFIPATARRYGLRVTPAKDERVHWAHATRAAARYLRDLYTEFGDWQLALAAYNAGEQAVANALARSRVRTFADLSTRRLLPAQTRNYVPAVLAAMELLGSAARAPGDEPSPQKAAGRSVYAIGRVGG